MKKNIRVLGIFGNSVGEIVRKDLRVCGGGVVHLMDDVVLPYPL